ncbi:MAG: YfjI family protein [Phocaeicola plebeius]|nr:YfjI family protein [Phocaeicola plebeius]
MSCYLISYEQGHKVARPVTSEEEYRRLRGSDEQRKNVYLARHGDEKAKRRLVQMNYSCLLADGRLKGCRTPSDTVGMDVDFDPSDPNYERKMAELQERIIDSRWQLGLLMLERSARKGYHLVFARRPGLSQQENLQWASGLLGVKYDEGAKDLTRVFFTTTDSPDDLLYLDPALFGKAGKREEDPPEATKKTTEKTEATGATEEATTKAAATEATAKTTAKAEANEATEKTATSEATEETATSEATEETTTKAAETEATEKATEKTAATEATEEAMAKTAATEATAKTMAKTAETEATAKTIAKAAETEATEEATAKTTETEVTEGTTTKTTTETTAEVAEEEETAAEIPEAATKELTYEGMPYQQIINKWWELYNGGQTPVKSNRNTLTYELAVNLRHICGFDRELMRQVIPCYDGFPEAERDRCIDSALETRRTQMPRRLREALEKVKAENPDDSHVVQALDDTVEQDELHYFHRLGRAARTQGIADTIAAVGPRLTMPVLTAVCPAIGTLATGVEVMIHGRPSRLNLFSFICGEAASGKGSIDPVVDAWMKGLKEQDMVYLKQEADYRTKMKRAKNDKKQPEEPKLPVRLLTLNNTLANLSDRLANTGGKHAFSYTCEADLVAQKWRSSISDYSVMLRQAFDGSAFHREAKSVEAVNVHIDHLYWNVTMCGTQDALYRVISNSTDGLLSRVAIARTPDNTFARLEEHPARLTEEQAERIGQVARVVALMQGRLELPRLEARSLAWTEAVRMESLKDNDRVKARCRMRDHVIAYRMTVCLMLCLAAERMIREYGETGAVQRLTADPAAFVEWTARTQTPSLLEAYDAFADSVLENDLYFFRGRIEQAYGSEDYRPDGQLRRRKSKNDSIYTRLPPEFGFGLALQVAQAERPDMGQNAVRQMLKNWENQLLAERTREGWKKLSH